MHMPCHMHMQRHTTHLRHRCSDCSTRSPCQATFTGRKPYGPVSRPFSRRHASARAEASSDLITYDEVLKAARNRGLTITLDEFGPFYTIKCHQGDAQGRMLAVTTGFVAPWFGLMHCDMLRIMTAGMKGDTGDTIRGGALGLGLLVGGAVFSYGFSKGCRKAEILAINDDDAWQKRLVRYYSFYGFEPVLVVEGDKLTDVPHMLVWGGAGTRMDADVERMLKKWSRSIRAMAAATEKRTQKQSDRSPEPTAV